MKQPYLVKSPYQLLLAITVIKKVFFEFFE